MTKVYKVYANHLPPEQKEELHNKFKAFAFLTDSGTDDNGFFIRVFLTSEESYFKNLLITYNCECIDLTGTNLL